MTHHVGMEEGWIHIYVVGFAPDCLDIFFGVEGTEWGDKIEG